MSAADRNPAVARISKAMIEKKINCPATSSCGRLFDAVAAMTGVCHEAAYEAQAALELMALADKASVAAAAPFPGVLQELRRRKADPRSEALVMPTAAVVRGAAGMLRDGAGAAAVSAAFHRTMIEMLAEAAVLLCPQEDRLPVVLGGGVFLNELLTDALVTELRHRDLDVYRPRLVPPGDGGLALGQAVVAAHLPFSDEWSR